MRALVTVAAFAGAFFLYKNSGSEAKVVTEPKAPEAVVAFMGTPMYADEVVAPLWQRPDKTR